MKTLRAFGDNVILEVYQEEKKEEKKTLIINPKKEEVQFYKVLHAECIEVDTIVMIKGYPISCELDEKKHFIVNKEQIIAYVRG